MTFLAVHSQVLESVFPTLRALPTILLFRTSVLYLAFLL
jgi:hypothetical protein